MDAENKLALGANAMALIIEGAEAVAMPAAAPAAVIAALQALTLIPDVNGQVILPAGVELDDIRVSGRDLIITMPDGTQMVITDGAIFVPQFVLDGIAVPPLNIAALLIGQETAPAAGRPTSSGGNFADPVGDIGDPFARGDLLPPTLLLFPEAEEPDFIPESPDEEPTTIIITPDQPAGSVSATAAVGEAGLPARGSEPAGSNEAGNNETTAGSIVFDVPDGLGSISLNGVAIMAVGQLFTTPLGQLTITSIAAGNIGYSYTLLDNSVNPSATDIFAVAVVDNDGDTATANLTITINDDAPTARNDTDVVPAANFTAQTGNVITGAGTSSGAAGVDTQGADSAAVTGARAGTSGLFAAVGSAINGAFGVLTLNTNGSYSYTRNPNTPGGVTDIFSYQITDGDGDTSTATLAISIGDSPATVLSVPSIGGGTVVDEEGLPPRGSEPPGSNEAAPIETTAGTITFSAPDGVASVQVNGVTINGPGQVILTPTGTFTVTGFSPTSGTLNYTFTLTDNTSGDNTTQVLTVTVTDADGDSDSETFTITIVDDTPTARNDSGAQTAENAGVTVNVISNDTPGADGVNLATGVAAVPGSLIGSGSLAYNNNGSFTYTPAPGEQGIVTFQYSITDGDGDVSTAIVTISLLEDSTPLVDVNGDSDAAEAGLPARGSEPSGSDAAANSEIAAGTITTATVGDSIASLVINGVNVTAGGTVTTAIGTLAVTLSAGVYSYTYTLTDNTPGDTTADSFNVVLTDSDGDAANDTLVIAIIDDVPAAADDSNGIAAGTFGPVTGNVVANDVPGADGASVTAVNAGLTAGSAGTALQGVYGVLTLNADGSYSYTRDASTPGGVSDVFTYTITDGDGDTASATLTISIADSPTSLDLPTTGEAGAQVDENGLPAGSNAAASSEITNGVIAYTAPDGPAIVTIEGVAVTLVGQIIAGASGSLRITSIAPGAIGYEYTLTTNTLGDATFDDFAVVVTDQDGDSTTATLVIDIIDDVPTARGDVDSVTEDAFVDGEGNPVADGNVIIGTGGSDANATDGVADSRGADGATVTAVAFGGTVGAVGGMTAGAYGTLIIGADGSYSYELNNFDPAVQGLDSNDTLTEIFTYTLTDGDGDVRTATLTITINGSDDPIIIGGLNVDGPELTVDEDDLADGSSPSAAALTQTGSFTVNGSDGIAGIAIEGANVAVGQTLATAIGIFTITSVSAPVDGTATDITIGYSYVLTDNSAHDNAGGENFLTEIFDIAVTDTDGSTDMAAIEVRIIDDVPTANDDTDFVASGGLLPATGNVITDAENDGGRDTQGADGAIVTAVAGGIVGGSTAGTYGVLTLNANGSYSYVRNDGSPGNVSDVFTYTITDGDGDTDTATLTITIEDARPITGDNPAVVLDDDALAGGNAGGTDDDAEPANVNGNLVGSGGDGTLSWALASTGAPVGFSYTANGTGIDIFQGATLVLQVTLVTATGAYSVTQLSPIAHATGNDENNQFFTLNYTVTDSDGDVVNGTLSINVDDDSPIAVAATTSGAVDEDGLLGGNTDGTGDLAGVAVVATGSVTGLFAAGADTPLAYSLSNDTSGLPALSAGGVTLSYAVVDNVLTATAGATLVFTLSLDPSTGAWSFTLLARLDHPSGADENDIVIDFGGLVIVADSDGDSVTATGSLTVTVDDDTPLATNDGQITIEGAPAIVGNVLTNDQVGADTPATVTAITGGAVSVPIATAFGTLTLNGNGSYSYTPNASVPSGSVDSFTYTITDSDGDTATATLSFTFEGDANRPTAGRANATVDDDALTDGNAGGTGDDDANFTEIPLTASEAVFTGILPHNFGLDGAGRITFAQLDGFFTIVGQESVQFGWNESASTLTGTGSRGVLFTVVVNQATGDYVFTLLDNVLHNGGSDENNATIILPYAVHDSDGSTVNGTLRVNADDDTPVAVLDTDAVTEDSAMSAAGNVLTGVGSDGNAAGADSFGADGGATTGAVSALAGGTIGAPLLRPNGTLTLNVDGSYGFALNNASAAVQGLDTGETILEVYTYTIRDGDGDTTTATLTITINGTNDAPVVAAAIAAVSEEGLAGSNPDLVGIADTTDNVVATGTIVTSDIDVEPLIFTLDTPATVLISNGLAISWTGAGTGTLIGMAGAVEVIRIALDNSGSYTVTLSGQIDHPVIGSEDDLDLVIPVDVSDGIATSPTTLTISIEDDSPIAVVTTTSGTVDEDGLANGIAGGIGDLAGVATSASGSVTGLFSTGTDQLASYSLSTSTADLPVLTSGGVAITYAVVGNLLTASAGVNPVFTLTLNAATGQWGFVLIRPVDHALGANENDIVLEFGGMIIATDRDGDPVTATGNLTVTIDDDMPSANDDAVTQAIENTPVTINVFADDQGGADGALVSTVALVGGSLAGTGTLANNGNGTFTYTPAPGETGIITFQYTITDADRDSDPATVTITLAADSTPAVVNVVAAVDDDGLPGGIAGLLANGDIDANIGDTGAGLGNEAVFVGQINVNFGGDTGTISFANLHGTSTMVGMEMVTFDWNAGANILTAIGPRGALFTVNLTPSGAYTVTLVDNVLHAPGNNEASAPVVNLNYLATDSDGDMNSAGVLAITFNDDAPIAIAPLAITLTNAAGSTGLSSLDTEGNIDNNAGADQFGLVRLPSTLQGATTLTSNGQVIYYFVSADGQTLTATTDSSGIANTSRWVFTVEINQDFDTTLGNDRYEVTLFDTVDSTESINFDPGTFDFLGGNTHWVGFVPLGQENAPINDGSQDLLITPIANGDTANGNANEVGSGGAGGGSLAVGPNQGLRLDFVNDLLGNPASGGGGYVGPSNHSFDGHYQVTGATIRFGVGGSASNTTTVRLIAFDDTDNGNVNQVGNGIQDPITRIVITYNTDTISTADDVVFTIDTSTPGTDTITFGGNNFTVITDMSGAVNFNGVQDGVSIGVFTANAFTTLEARYVSGREFTLTGFGTTAITNDPVNLNIPVQFQDADGDIAASSNLAITLSPAIPPIVLDLDGDGAEFLSQSAGVTFDYQGDGSPESTAWVGADDGLLAIDLNGDGIVNDGSEIVFGRDGQTDLQGLAATYDSDGNNILDAADAAFARFGVWQDSNSNGVTDEGEFRSLSDAGITNISLQSDGLRYSAANGDVVVQGETTFVRADGSASIAADASFAVGAAQIQQREQANSNALVAASLIALAGADIAAQDAAFAAVRDGLESREFDVDSASAPPIIAGPAADAAATLQHSEYLPEVKTADPLPLDTMPITQLWDTAGLAQQDIPVVRSAPVETGYVVQLPSSGESILSQSIPTGLIDALLLVGDAQPGLDEQENPALQDVIADTLNDNSIDDLLDQLTGMAGESFAGGQSTVPGDNADLASNLINMPVASNVITLITGVSISDQLQDMAANQA